LKALSIFSVKKTSLENRECVKDLNKRMIHSKLHPSYEDFADSVKKKARYIQQPEVLAFLDTLKSSWATRAFPLGDDKYVWRAQIGCDLAPVYDHDEHIADEPLPFAADRMKPLKDGACEGRANPKGIPMLYTATDRETAIAEVRPWMDAQVSVAQLRILRELKLVNCFERHGKRNISKYFKENPTETELAEWAWEDIDNAFSCPVTDNDRSADYVPTQVLAEFFRENGFDGIAFKSSVAGGHNLVLFNPDDAEIVHSQVVKVKNVSYTAEWSGGDRFIDLDRDI